MKYTPGLMVGELSKKAGNTVASHNRNGPYFRTRTVPTNPRTTLQTIIRDRVSTNSAAWRALTAAQRAGFTALGTGMTRIDSLGRTYNLTGEQAYQSINLNRFLLGSAALSTAPTLDTPAALLSITPTITA